jgi:hypothetical protein
MRAVHVNGGLPPPQNVTWPSEDYASANRAWIKIDFQYSQFMLAKMQNECQKFKNWLDFQQLNFTDNFQFFLF